MTVAISDITSKKLSLLSLLSAILVVFLHAPTTDAAGFSYWIENFVSCNLATVAVPFFFVASGYLLGRHIGEDGWYRSACRKRVVTLLTPYLVWCVILGTVANVNSLIANVIHHQPLLRYICLDPIRLFGLDPRFNPAMPLWFVRELILLVLISPLLSRITRNEIWSIIFFVVLIAIGCTTSLFVPTQFSEMVTFTVSPLNVLYFSIGMYLTDRGVLISGCIVWAALVFGLVLMAFNTFCQGFMPAVPLPMRALLRFVAIAFFLIGAWGVCPVVTLPAFLRGQQFPIYLLHPIFMTITLMAKNLVPDFTLSLVGYTFFVSICVCCSMMTSIMLKKHFPKVAQILFGGRA